MKKMVSQSLLFLLLQSVLFTAILPKITGAQTTQTTETAALVKADGPPAFGLTDGMPVKLKLSRVMSSADAKTGETVDFEVIEDVKIGETVIIRSGVSAIGTVTEAKPKRRMGRSGKLSLNITYVPAASGDKIPLRAIKENKGKSHVGVMTTAMVATGILFFPAAPLFLFLKGKDITLPKGTEVTAYIDGDIALDQSRFVPNQIAATNAADTQNAPASDSADLLIKSTPDGAEIEVDGKFVGSTPSTLQLKAGEYKIVIKKLDYMTWERSIVLAAGSSITIDAQLLKP